MLSLLLLLAFLLHQPDLVFSDSAPRLRHNMLLYMKTLLSFLKLIPGEPEPDHNRHFLCYKWEHCVQPKTLKNISNCCFQGPGLNLKTFQALGDGVHPCRGPVGRFDPSLAHPLPPWGHLQGHVNDKVRQTFGQNPQNLAYLSLF